MTWNEPARPIQPIPIVIEPTTAAVAVEVTAIKTERADVASRNPHMLAYAKHRDAAAQSFRLFVGLCGGAAPPRVPGCSTDIRLAWRIECGRSVEEAAAREYLYRWYLAIKAPDQCGATGKPSHEPRDRNPRACLSIFGVPHTIGM